jgi:hypothetical protein
MIGHSKKIASHSNDTRCLMNHFYYRRHNYNVSRLLKLQCLWLCDPSMGFKCRNVHFFLLANVVIPILCDSPRRIFLTSHSPLHGLINYRYVMFQQEFRHFSRFERDRCQSHVTTDCRSVCMSWCRGPFWDLYRQIPFTN